MSREIRFRVWDKVSQDYYGNMSTRILFASTAGRYNRFGPEFNIMRWNGLGSTALVGTGKPVSDLVWEQFTGLKDTKGVDIYEGDIVRGEVYGTPHWGAVEWKAPRFMAEDKLRRAESGDTTWIPLDSHYPVEVVGNIHQHPDLFKTITP